MEQLFELVKARKSVRTFENTPVSEQDLAALQAYAETIDNPFGIPVRFVFLNAKETGLSSPVLSGESWYIAAMVEKKAYADVAFGYAFEQLVLYAQSLGLGTVWIGGTMKRELFEAAAGVQEGEVMPCVTPIGYPAKKRSVKEMLMRKGISADLRFAPEKLFFEQSFDQPYAPDASEEELFECVRWAPSAVNKQPWRIIVKDGAYHFYEKKDKGYDNPVTGDLQKIDVGIAICHFVLGAEAQGKQAKVSVQDPGIALIENTEYIASVSLH